MSDVASTLSASEPDRPAPAASAPAVERASATPPVRAFSGRLAIGLGLVSLLVAALALVVGAWLWQKLGQTQQELARRIQDSGALVEQARALAGQTEAQTREIEARLAVAELRLSEVSLQRSQLEELMLSLSRSRDDNLVQDLESAIRLAQQQSQLTGSVAPLLAALQAADQRIARAAQPRLNPVQRALARDIERVRGAAVADVPSVVLRLDELARQVDSWPVANQVGVVDGPLPVSPAAVPATPSPEAAAEASTSVTTIDASNSKAVNAQPAPVAAALPAEAVLPPEVAAAPLVDTGWGARWRIWWDRAWRETVRASRDLVRVSRIDQPEAALLAPEQAYFLRENLKLRLLNARLGLLGRHPESALVDLASVDAALERYFDTGSPSIASAQVAIAKLREELRLGDLPRADESLAALATAAGGR
jgi:uroporphyrin-3 C-methyltransferase